ncbi:hypothetical protein LguiB_027370 [Lonicera macranthoides]
MDCHSRILTYATQDTPALCESTTTKCLAPFKELLGKLNDTSSSNVPPVTCIISDGIMSFTVAVAEELGIPEVLFWTTSACGFFGYVQYPNLVERGLTPLKDSNDFMLNFAFSEIERAKRASAIILNTFDELKHDVLDALSSM